MTYSEIFQIFGPSIGALFIISLLTSLFGSFVIDKKISLMGESLSHAVIPGIALGVLFFGFSFWSLFLGAFLFLVIYSVAMIFLKNKFPHSEDSLFASFQAGSLAIGALLLSNNNLPINISHILLGNIFAVSFEELKNMAIVALIVVALFFYFRKKMLSYFFDTNFYKIKNKDSKVIQFFFDLSIGVVVIISLQSVGSLLSLGMLVIPSLIALFFAKNFRQTYVIAFLVCFVSSLLGLWISYTFNFSAGPSIITLLFSSLIIVTMLTHSKV